jgi:hypothetical protein
MSDLLPCPCGQTPKELLIEEGYISKYAYVSGQCCNEWEAQFITNYSALDSDECMELAIKRWNSLPRGVSRLEELEALVVAAEDLWESVDPNDAWACFDVCVSQTDAELALENYKKEVSDGRFIRNYRW